MDTAIWIYVFLPLFLVLFTLYQTNKKKKQLSALKIIKTHKRKGGFNMSETVKRFVGKECIITTMNETVTGVIESVEDNWIVVATGKNATNTEIISIDYISRLREYPRTKNGNKKMIVS